MANIREVAEQCGVSIASVSRILNNDATYKAAPETREKVFRVAAEMGYHLNGGRNKKARAVPEKNIACIINVTAEKHDDGYYTTILSGIKNELSKHNYAVKYLKSQYEISDADVLTNIFKQDLSGIILMTKPYNEAQKIIRKNTKNIISIDTTIEGYDSVRYNMFEAGCKAMQHLIENGHKKIAFVGSDLKDNFSSPFGRFDAYRIMLKMNGLDVHPDWIIDCKWQRALCFQMTKNLMHAADRPTAIFFASDYMAISGISALAEEGLKIPDDISIIGISDIEEAEYLNPPLTTVRIPQFEIGQITAAALLARINGDRTPAKQIFVPTKLIVRQSVKNMSTEQPAASKNGRKG